MHISITCIGYMDKSLTREGLYVKRKKHLKKRRSVRKHPVPKNIKHPPILPAFSSLNISKMLSQFMTFRSMIQDLSSSLQRMEKMLDSAYQMFEITQNFIGTRNQSRQSLLPTNPDRKPSSDNEEDLPMINLPPDQESPIQSPFAQLFRQIDPRFLFQLLQSPLVQRLISQFFTAPQKSASRIKLPTRRKQG